MTRVCTPESITELQDFVTEAHARAQALHVTGAGTHTRPGLRDEAAAILDMTGLKTLRDLDRKSALAHVEVGITLGELERSVASEGFTLAHWGPLPEGATVGGLLSRFWPVAPVVSCPDLRASCIGLTAFFGPGQRYHYLPAPRKASGPDLRGWFIGAEGRAGVITEAWLGLARRPERDAHLVLDLDSLQGAIDAIIHLLRGGVRARHVGLHIEAEHIRLCWTLGGVAPLVELWEHQIEDAFQALGATFELAPGGDPKALRGESFTLEDRFTAYGIPSVLRQALDICAGLNAVSVTHWTPHGARLSLPRADTSDALMELAWTATSDAPMSSWAHRVLQPLAFRTSP